MGGDSGTVIVRSLKTAAGLSVSTNGKWKVWHVLILTHVTCWVLGKFL